MSTAALAAKAAPYPLSSTFFHTVEAIDYFEPRPSVAIAVSGGADSMALLLLLKEWITKNSGSLTALTVNHGLRKEATDEAAWVQKECGRLGVAHHILTYSGKKPATAIQETARDIRYQLLADWCKTHHVRHLFTAHHQGDQAETFFFRLARGSGLDGLACMQPSVTLDNGVRLLRPLLSVPKAELVDFLRQETQRWLEDPSNLNKDYTRVRIRQALAASPESEEVIARACEMAVLFGEFRKLLEEKTAEKLASCVTFSLCGVQIEANKLALLEQEYGRRILAIVVRRVGGKTHNPRTEKMERFYPQLIDNIASKRNIKRTFSCCIFHLQPKLNRIVVSPE